MRRLLFLILVAIPAFADTTVTLLQFSDYHSHAVPFYTEEGERGGIARAVRYLRSEKRHGALVFSGGDMLNHGAPAWSDRYGCAEWPWLNGIVDAMALGNHDGDYGREALDGCREALLYPVLSANTEGFSPYATFDLRGVRIGVFAIAGPDFPSLVKQEGFVFGDSVAAARAAVTALREKEHVQAVVMIGHEHAEADTALAQAVPGIDLIFGSHSHLVRAMTQIPGTRTWFLSPGQYLAWISRVELTIGAGGVTAARGSLIAVDRHLPEDRRVARRVRRMQRALERDPKYRELFVTVADLPRPLGMQALAQRTLEAMRAATQSEVALSTVSSFRQPLDRGALTLEELRAALPYDNEIVVCAMPGAQLQRVLDFGASRAGTDSEPFVSGAPEAVDPGRTYRVATTDYLANGPYREVFVCDRQKSGLHVREELRKALATPR